MACVASRTPRSTPAVMLTSTFRAPAIEMPSRSGDEIASCAAFCARFSPDLMADDMSAVPPSSIVVRMSAKSRLMRPWTVMSSEIPRVAL